MERTKTDSALAEAEQAHADDPERAELLRRARRFKTSWIELAEALTATRRSEGSHCRTVWNPTTAKMTTSGTMSAR